MVQYYFPPLGGIGSLRAARFASSLPEFGWQPTVLAPRVGSYYQDPTLPIGETAVVRTATIEPARIWKRATGGDADDTRAARVGRWSGRLRALAHRFLYRPDPQVGWYPFAMSAGRALLCEQRFDAVFSSSFPITAHLIARRLARDGGLPWIAEFRDPWAHVQGNERRASAHALEARLLGDADAAVTVSPTLEGLFRAEGARRIEVITNGFDESAQVAGDAPLDDFVVTHVGSYYPHMQDLGALWPALRAVLDGQPTLRARVRLVGGESEPLRRAVEEAGLGPALDVMGFLDHGSAMGAMRQSSVLVVAGSRQRHPVYDGLLPAKLFEYLASGRPVLYVGERDTDAGRLLAGQPGCWLVAPGHVAGARAALEAIRRGPASYPRHVDHFGRRELARRLAALLDEVTAAPPPRTRSA